MRLLAARGRSEAELGRRLARKGFPPAVVEDVLAWCRGLGYLDDARFAEEWIRSRASSQAGGRRRVMYELRGKGVAPDLAREKLDELFPEADERAACLAVARRHIARLQDLPPEVRWRRLGTLLLRRGFPSALVQWALAEVDSDYESH